MELSISPICPVTEKPPYNWLKKLELLVLVEYCKYLSTEVRIESKFELEPSDMLKSFFIFSTFSTGLICESPS